MGWFNHQLLFPSFYQVCYTCVIFWLQKKRHGIRKSYAPNGLGSTSPPRGVNGWQLKNILPGRTTSDSLYATPRQCTAFGQTGQRGVRFFFFGGFLPRVYGPGWHHWSLLKMRPCVKPCFWGVGVITSHEFWAVWMMDCLRTFGVSFGLNVQELGEIFLGKIDEVYGVDIFLPPCPNFVFW